jgi:hypothetical protein
MFTFRATPVNYREKCADRGNRTQLCTERCPMDGKSCITEIEIDACTCRGMMLKTKESVKYDMKTYVRRRI